MVTKNNERRGDFPLEMKVFIFGKTAKKVTSISTGDFLDIDIDMVCR